jgi:hypothetical protein
MGFTAEIFGVEDQQLNDLVTNISLVEALDMMLNGIKTSIPNVSE